MAKVIGINGEIPEEEKLDPDVMFESVIGKFEDAIVIGIDHNGTLNLHSTLTTVEAHFVLSLAIQSLLECSTCRGEA